MRLVPPWLVKTFDATVTPLASSLADRHVDPNLITTVGTLVLMASGAAFAAAYVRVGGLLLLASGVCDMLDGKVARRNGVVSKFGGFYDSTLDRIGEATLYLGIAWYFVSGGVAPGLAPLAMTAAFIAAAGGIIVSYARARAEGLGLDCRVGLVQRAERIVGLGVPTLFFGPGRHGYLLLALVSVLGLLAVITVVQRIVHVYRITRAPVGEPSRRPVATRRDPVGKGQRGS